MAEIKEIAAEGYTQFKASYRNGLAAKKALLESIEACIDISNHIIATQGFRRPADCKDIFSIMGEQDILDKHSPGKCRKWPNSRICWFTVT